MADTDQDTSAQDPLRDYLRRNFPFADTFIRPPDSAQTYADLIQSLAARAQVPASAHPPPSNQNQLPPQSTGNYGPAPTYDVPPAPQLQNVPQPPQTPEANPFDAFKNPVVGLAIIGSLFTRRPLVAAMGAAGSAMKAQTQLQHDTFDQNKEKFHEQLEEAVAQNRIELERYQAAWDRKKGLDWQKSLPDLWAEAARNDDKMGMQALKTGPEMWERLQISREAANNKLNNLIETMNARAEVERSLKPTLSDEALEQAAARENAGDHSWKSSMGRGIQGKADIMAVMNRAAEMATGAGLTGTDIAEKGAQYTGEKAYQRTAGGYAAKVESAVNEATGLVPQALEASEKLPRTRWVKFNELYQQFQQGTSDPAYNDFMAANIALLNTYIRAMNPQGVPRITERLEAHAIGLLSTAVDQQAYEIQVRRLWKEMQISKAATAKTRAGTAGPEEFPEKSGQTQAVKVKTPDEAQKLAPGTHYLTPDGAEYVR